jgi:hypothetical protein
VCAKNAMHCGADGKKKERLAYPPESSLDLP